MAQKVTLGLGQPSGIRRGSVLRGVTVRMLCKWPWGAKALEGRVAAVTDDHKGLKMTRTGPPGPGSEVLHRSHASVPRPPPGAPAQGAPPRRRPLGLEPLCKPTSMGLFAVHPVAWHRAQFVPRAHGHNGGKEQVLCGPPPPALRPGEAEAEIVPREEAGWGEADASCGSLAALSGLLLGTWGLPSLAHPKERTTPARLPGGGPGVLGTSC